MDQKSQEKINPEVLKARKQFIEDEFLAEGYALLEELNYIEDDNDYALESWRIRADRWLIRHRILEILKEKGQLKT